MTSAHASAERLEISHDEQGRASEENASPAIVTCESSHASSESTFGENATALIKAWPAGIVSEKLKPIATPWYPTILRLAPLSGLGALLLAVGLLIASYAILAASNGDEISSWKFEPNVYLAIFTGK
jgi:hypothetical protein